MEPDQTAHFGTEREQSDLGSLCANNMDPDQTAPTGSSQQSDLGSYCLLP